MATPSHSATPEQPLWFYADANNQPQGPVSSAELQRLAGGGVIGSGTPIMYQGGTEWTTYSSLCPDDDSTEAPIVIPPPSEPTPYFEPEPRFAIPSMAGIKERLLTWWNEHPLWIGLIVFALVFKIAIHLPDAPKSQHHSTASTASVNKANDEEDAQFTPPSSYEHGLVTGFLSVALVADVQQDGSTFKVQGKANANAGKNLPDGTRIFVAVETDINGVTVGSSGEAVVKDGTFEFAAKSSYDDSPNFPSGAYKLRLALNPSRQLTKIQAKFGERGSNLTGPQVQVGKDGAARAQYEGFFAFNAPGGDQKKQQIESDITTRRAEFGSLYRDLQKFKDDPIFWRDGFAKPSWLWDWQQRVRNLGAADKSQSEDYGRRLSRMLETLAMSYQRSKGTETTVTRDDLKWFLADYRKIAPKYEGLATTSQSILNIVRKLKTGAVRLSQGPVYFVFKGANDAFEVVGTSEQYAFYQTSEDSSEDVQIAVERVPGEFYGNGAKLKQKLFQVVGTSRFSTVGGGDVDLVVLRPLPET